MFEPSGLITRGAFAEYITKAIGIFRSDYESNQKFIDVTYANEFFKSISIANEYGIISGYPDNTFKPDQTITRQEAMAMFSNVMRVINYYGTDTTRINSFTDKEEVSSWAYQSVKDVLAARLFNGKTIDTIAPLDTITYSEAATALWNLLVEANLINS